MTAKKIMLSLVAALLFTSIDAQVFTIVWKTEPVFKVPESVYYDQARDQIYVSNINGKPSEKDGNGFLSLLSPDGKILKLQWVTGLDAPKGMTMIDSLLYVTDIDKIRVIDVTKVKVIKTIPVPGSEFLNDVTADDKGNVYISDTRKNNILKLSNDTVKVWLTDDKIISPNGLAFNKNKLMVGTKNDLLAVDPDSKSVHVRYEDVGPIDGLVPVGGQKYVISDWAGRVMLVSPSQKVVLGNTTNEKKQAADLGFIPDKKLILAPTFFDNRVVARTIP